MTIESDDYFNKKIAQGFQQLPKKVVNKILKVHLKKYAKELADDAKNEKPEETRELARKIKARVGKRSDIAANYLVGVSAKDFKTAGNPKASIQEYGSEKKNIKEQSYLRKPFDERAEHIATQLQKDIIDDIETELGK